MCRPRWTLWLTLTLGICVLLVGPLARPARAQAEAGVEHIRLEGGVAAPAGAVALRYSRQLWEGGASLEPGLGLGYTGTVLSLLASHPLFGAASSEGSGLTSLYAGMAMGVLGEGTRHPWASSAGHLPDGAYHWLDIGISQHASMGQLHVVAGVGVSVLLDEVDVEGEDLIAVVPEWWINEGWAPSLWVGIGLPL